MVEKGDDIGIAFIELKNRLEAVLFSAGKRVHIDEVSKMVHDTKENIMPALFQLKKDYEERPGSLMIIQDGDFWKTTVKEKYLTLIQNIVIETELPKSVMETLAVIAYKNPILQADLIRIRTNKAYDHLKELEDTGYISREIQGRTKRIKLTNKFFEYFDIPQERLKKAFGSFEAVENAIMEKEYGGEVLTEKQEALTNEIKNASERRKERTTKGQIEVFNVEQKNDSEDYSDSNSETKKSETLNGLEVVEMDKDASENNSFEEKPTNVKKAMEESKAVDDAVERIMAPIKNPELGEDKKDKKSLKGKKTKANENESNDSSDDLDADSGNSDSDDDSDS